MLRTHPKLIAASLLVAGAISYLIAGEASASATRHTRQPRHVRHVRHSRHVRHTRHSRHTAPRTLAASAPQAFLTTSTLSYSISHVADLQFSSTAPPGVLIPVNDSLRYQRIGGIGAAMTDTSAWLIEDQLPVPLRAQVMDALFGADGIHLSFLRIPIAASDFTVGGRPYSYDEMPAGQADPSLANFSIAHDTPYILPALRSAVALNPQILFLASPWTAPSWMKANDALDDLGGSGALLPGDYPAFAQYLVRFIQSYASQGIRIAAVTPENEPSDGHRGIPFPGMTIPVAAEASFVVQNLAPALRSAGLATKIYGADNSWNQLVWGAGLLSGPAASSLAGLAWHCYFGSPAYMTSYHQTYPGADQLVDECSPEIRPLFTAEFLISSLRNWASSVALWNLALDPAGGPVQPPNSGCLRCGGVITVDERTHTVRFDKKFFQLGQVSKFVHPGAFRIDSPNFVSYALTPRDFPTVSPGLDDVAFLNPDGSKVLVAYNNHPFAVPLAVETRGRYFGYRLPGWAMATFVWDRPSSGS
jgi:glucosylceramidase